MPGVYKEKNCEKCGKLHRKRGKFCSASCGNSGRVFTEERKKHHREKNREYLETPEGVAYTKKMAELAKGNEITQMEDIAVEIPDIRDLSDFDMLENYPRAEKW